MEKFLNHIPGYRTKKKRNMIIASIYYAFCLLSLLTVDFYAFLFFISVPFMVFSLIAFVREKSKKQLIIAGVCFVLMIVGLNMSDTGTDVEQTSSPLPTAAVSLTPTSTPESTATPTPEPTPEPTAAPTPEPTPEPISEPVSDVQSQSNTSSSNSVEYVYVGNTGTKYHYQSCRTLKGKGHQITMEAAIAQGYTSCGVCHR